MADAEQIRACPDGAVAERDRLAARMGVPMSGIANFCDRWGVEELALFGSVLRDDFGPDSDIDVLVRFKAGRTPGLFAAARIRRELAEMCRRRVDLVHRPTIERSRNYIRRKRILESARVLYAAGTWLGKPAFREVAAPEMHRIRGLTMRLRQRSC